jgi:hypothetical protein
MNANAVGEVFQKKPGGHYSLHIEEKDRVVGRLLGNWWIEGALRGVIPRLPVVNVNPIIREVSKKDQQPVDDEMKECSSPIHNDENSSSSSNINKKVIYMVV